MSKGSGAKKAEVKKTTVNRAHIEQNGVGRSGGVFLFVCMAALFVSVCGIIFLFTKAFFHSDSAFFVQLAVEQIKSGKLFPPGMCYSTVLFVRSPNLILVPILKVVKDWMLARELMVIVMWVILILAVFYLFMPKRDRNPVAAIIACMLLMNPYQTLDVANETTDMLFFQGAYVTIFFDVVFTLGIMHRIILMKPFPAASGKCPHGYDPDASACGIDPGLLFSRVRPESVGSSAQQALYPDGRTDRSSGPGSVCLLSKAGRDVLE